ncbi:MAG: 2'-5' RNA ligase family protein [Cyanobacteria bacterium P01_F01_bin.116]
MATSFYSVWLVPQEPDLSYFQTLINDLANRFSTVSFCPHVTLYSGYIPALLDIQRVYSALASHPPVELEIMHLSYETRFSKTLYVQLRTSPGLSQLVHQLVAHIADAQPPIVDPHVSLLYHHLEADIKETLIRDMAMPRPNIRFNQLQVIAAPQNFETQEHVSKLRHVHSQFLNTP